MSHKYDLSKENKGVVDTALDFPRLKLEKKGEKARLAIFGIETEDGQRKLALPRFEGGYFFDLRIPGHERDYVGSFECLAPEATKIEGNYDADGCPHCAVVLQGNVSEEVMGKRKRRMIIPVVRYKTQPGSSELVVPYSVEVLGWKLTDRYFNVLVDENEKWATTKGLLGHDITLTCEVVQYQNFTVSVEPSAAYAENRDLGQLVLETFINQTSSLPEGLSRVLGSKLAPVDLEKKISDTIEAAAQLGIGAPAQAAIPTVDPATIAGLAEDLLGQPEVPAAETETPASDVSVVVAEPVPVDAGPVDFDAFFGGDKTVE